MTIADGKCTGGTAQQSAWIVTKAVPNERNLNHSPTNQSPLTTRIKIIERREYKGTGPV